jgi:hypothetical protein
MNKLVNMEPFYFRSYYYCVKGVAHDRKELESELKRLERYRPWMCPVPSGPEAYIQLAQVNRRNRPG